MNPSLRNVILAPQGIVKKGLVAWYDFSDGTGQVLADKSTLANTGQLGSTAGADTNDPSWVAAGLSFGGDDYVVLPANISTYVEKSLNYTLEMVTSSGADGAVLFSCTSASNNRMGVYVSSGILRIGHYDGAAYNGLASGAIAIAEPNHISYAYKGIGGIGELLINGTPTVGSTATATNTTVGVRIGSATNNATSFTGVVSYLLIYNRALTSLEKRTNRRALKRILVNRGVLI